MPAPSDAPARVKRTRSSRSPQRGTSFSGGARVGNITSDADGGDATAPVAGTGSTTTPPGLGPFAPDRRDSPLAALGLDGWGGGTSAGAPAIGAVPGDARSGVKGVAASGGRIADSDRTGAPGSKGFGDTLSPFGQDGSPGLLILLGLLLALALLVRHELPRR